MINRVCTLACNVILLIAIEFHTSAFGLCLSLELFASASSS